MGLIDIEHEISFKVPQIFFANSKKRGGGMTAGQPHRKMKLWWRPSILSSNPMSHDDRAGGKENVKMGVNIVAKVGVDAS